MNDFQVSLVVIGAIFIIGVYGFNRWQEQKYRKQTEKMFHGDRQDVLFDSPEKKMDERLEPSLETFPFAIDHDESAANAAATNVNTRYAYPSHDENSDSGLNSIKVSESVSNLDEEKSEPVIDEAIDLIAIIKLPKAVAVENFKRFIARTQTFSKPVNWEGLVVGRWKPLASMGFYSEVKIAMQLADRRGPVTTTEISDFSAMVKQFAVELDGDAHAETETSAAERATDLDGFCADVDVEIGLNIMAGQTAMPATTLRTLAEAAGMVLKEDGVFYLNNTNGLALFSLRNAEPRPFLEHHIRNISTRSVTLLLDVPRVSEGLKAFNQMLQLGHHIADAMDAKLVDDNGKELIDSGADSIRRQLASLYQMMDGFEIQAGSPVALRLFS